MSPIPKFNGTCILNELIEFGSFAAGTQRYIRRALDIALGRRDALVCWSRNDAESKAIAEHYRAYARLDELRALVPDDYDVAAMAQLMGPLVTLSAFDLGQGQLNDFAAYRFLYERLFGAGIRPWLPPAYCAAATLPHLHPDHRRALLESIDDQAVSAIGWSPRHPRFIPEWVDEVDATTALRDCALRQEASPRRRQP